MNGAWIFIAIAVVYAVLKVYLEKRWAGLDAVGDDPDLTNLAFSSGRSAYEVFQAAGPRWNVASRQIDTDFRTYLKDGSMPHYVRDYLRRHRQRGDRTYQQIIFSGGRPPYL